MRAAYTVLAATLMTFAYLDALSPAPVFAIAALMGVLRPSDLVMRYALVAETMPPGILMGGMSISRTTTDSARVAGALAGAGLVSLLGMGPAYTVIAVLYAVRFALPFGVARRGADVAAGGAGDRTSTRLHSSHSCASRM